jgi:hypothetical protein
MVRRAIEIEKKYENGVRMGRRMVCERGSGNVRKPPKTIMVRT